MFIKGSIRPGVLSANSINKFFITIKKACFFFRSLLFPCGYFVFFFDLIGCRHFIGYFKFSKNLLKSGSHFFYVVINLRRRKSHFVIASILYHAFDLYKFISIYSMTSKHCYPLPVKSNTATYRNVLYY